MYDRWLVDRSWLCFISPFWILYVWVANGWAFKIISRGAMNRMNMNTTKGMTRNRSQRYSFLNFIWYNRNYISNKIFHCYIYFTNHSLKILCKNHWKNIYYSIKTLCQSRIFGFREFKVVAPTSQTHHWLVILFEIQTFSSWLIWNKSF